MSGPTYDLGILINGIGRLQAKVSFMPLLTSYGVENLHYLFNSSPVNLKAMSITTLGTAGNDSLWAPSSGANDILDGREDNDTLAGGNDANIFSARNDIINETSGDDSIRQI
jgi:Ca2+-binding RTX toxin-like protein